MIEESFLLVNIHLSNLHFSPATPATSPALTIQARRGSLPLILIGAGATLYSADGESVCLLLTGNFLWQTGSNPVRR